MEKNRKMQFYGSNLARNEQIDRRFMLMIIFWVRGGCLLLNWDSIYVYDQNVQISFTLKPLRQSKPNCMLSILRKSKGKFV